MGDLASEVARYADVRIVVPAVRGAADEEGYRGAIVSRFHYFPAPWQDLAEGAIYENLRTKPSRALQVLPFFVAEWNATRRAVREFRPDVVHAHWIIPQGLISLLAARRTPTLLTTLGGDLYALDRWPINRVMSRIIRHARGVTVMNQDMRSRVIRLGAESDRVHIMPMGADLSGIRPATHQDRREVRLLFVGRLVPKKGLAVLLEALRRVPEEALWRLTVVGDGPLREELRQAAVDLPVEFVGALSKERLRDAYAGADMIITPSVPADSGDQDGLPVAMLEAMCAGLPVIASNLPGINEVVVDGRNGILVPPGDSERLASAVTRLVTESQERAAFGAAAREVASKHSTEAMGRAYYSLLRDVATQERP
ncbi:MULTISPECIES: glycosyltransferase family 4 protein [unclassified Actinobaculum]|uniref:glycosyltransferase family 4 protein n=1 Tax=unclassified Actinobaculum TaxID=2609299 RepID=UPI0013DE0518|nr:MULTISPECIES: glycosyltransferase family 4 protein [unclassified Actinobaculum]